ncbi:MAG: glutathione S-transferase N-terminal domain-containing protein [Novosphingobium sp.]
MIDLLTAPTPNGWKVSIMLEECALDYEPRWIDLAGGGQHRPEFTLISPNGRIPAIVDHDPVDSGPSMTIFESGAILQYLAEKTGLFLPGDLRGRKTVFEWLFWQVGGLGPMLGQHGHFKLYASERLAYPTERYRAETLRLYAVLDRRLEEWPYVAGAAYTIADMACFPWIQTYKAQEITLAGFPHIQRWYETLKERPALRRGMALGRDRLNQAQLTEPRVREVLFGIKDGQ